MVKQPPQRERTTVLRRCLLQLLILVGLWLVVVHWITKELSSFTTGTKIEESRVAIGKSTFPNADDCHHVFIDGGANIGVHGRFLLEPEKYPKAKTALAIFDANFGQDRDNRDFCVFAIEPNPSHLQELQNKSKAYEAMGWRYHVMNVGLSDKDGVLPFYRQNDTEYNEWGFSIKKPVDGGTENNVVNVPVIRFSKWLQDNIFNRKLPTKVHGQYSRNATIVIKLDLESSEFVVIPDLISSGAFCQVDFIFGEFHRRDPPYFSGMKAPLNTTPEATQLKQALLLVMKSFSRTCKAQFHEVDDEAYLWDGVPLPTPP